jgi:hypothetical protein
MEVKRPSWFAHFWHLSVPDKNTTLDNSSWDNETILFFFCLESDQTRCLKRMLALLQEL